MSLRDAVARRIHTVLCRPGKTPRPDWGCCGCGAREMDAYLTVEYAHCGEAGEGYCWACIDEPGWPAGITLADFTILPGRER